jgi:molybdopterin-containing oxidoreductase family iron-sulfur binding subunit
MSHHECEHTDAPRGCDGAPEESVEEQRIALSRRGFLKGVGATAGVIAAGMLPAVGTILASSASPTTAGAAASEESTGIPTPAEHFAHVNEEMIYPGKPVYYADPAGDEKWAMVIDVNACIGCRRCVYACVRENNIGRNSGFTYIQVLEMEKGSNEMEHASLDYEMAGNPDRWYLPVQCMQCAKPTCVLGCPVKATWKEPDGIVVVDYKKCISCRNCLVTCPYEARHNNWVHPHIPENDVNPKVPYEDKAGVVEKCTFCVHRTRNGQTTACVEACPVGARTFGDLNDPDSAVSVLLKTKKVFRLKEELGNEPMIWYVG